MSLLLWVYLEIIIGVAQQKTAWQENKSTGAPRIHPTLLFGILAIICTHNQLTLALSLARSGVLSLALSLPIYQNYLNYLPLLHRLHLAYLLQRR